MCRGVAGLLKLAESKTKNKKMAFGARGSARDFGLTSGLALPDLQRENYAASGQAFMPNEKKGRKKQFAVEQKVSFTTVILSLGIYYQLCLKGWIRKNTFIYC